jgi:hypothetical protein
MTLKSLEEDQEQDDHGEEKQNQEPEYAQDLE